MAVAQGEELSQDRCLRRLELTGMAYAPESRALVAGRQGCFNGIAHRFAGLVRAPALLQLRFQPLAQRQQVVGVEAGVVEQILGKGPLAPIGPLAALVKRDGKLLLQDVPQAGLLPAESPGGDARVEDAPQAELEIALQA